MSIFTKIKYWCEDIKNMYLQSKLDKVNYKKFKEIIEQEYLNRKSKFNEFNLKPNDDYSGVGYIITIPEEYQLAGQDWQIMDKLNEFGYFVSIYLSKDLGFANYISEPHYYHIEDPNDDDAESCTYLGTWEYRPMLGKKEKTILYSTLSIGSIVILGLIAGLGFLIL